jgi:hypothetical protein
MKRRRNLLFYERFLKMGDAEENSGKSEDRLFFNLNKVPSSL